MKPPDDVTAAESNPVGFRFAIPNRFQSIIASYASQCVFWLNCLVYSLVVDSIVFVTYYVVAVICFYTFY